MTILDWLLWAGYFLALLAIVTGWAWTIVLFVAGGRYERYWREQGPGDESNYLWVFMVPALNEGVTIADSVGRLRAVAATHKVMLVINDGSEDNTGEVLGINSYMVTGSNGSDQNFNFITSAPAPNQPSRRMKPSIRKPVLNSGPKIIRSPSFAGSCSGSAARREYWL